MLLLTTQTSSLAASWAASSWLYITAPSASSWWLIYMCTLSRSARWPWTQFSFTILAYSSAEERRTPGSTSLSFCGWSTDALYLTGLKFFVLLQQEGSGVFRISVKSGKGAVGVEGSGVWWRRQGSSPEKKIIFFVPKMTVWVHSAAVFNRQKTRDSHEKLGTRTRNDRNLQNSAKLSKKSR